MTEIQIGRLVKDVEIGARIFGQVRALQPETYLPEQKHADLMSIVIRLMQKLEKAKYHADRCGEIRSPSADISPQPGARHVDHTSGVEAEAEAFLIQAKATLDILAKVLRPTAGISLGSFGDKGVRVVKALTRNVPADRRARANEVIRLIEEDKEWLAEMIGLRDTVAHFDGLESSGLSAELVDDKVVVRQPTDKRGRPLAAIVRWLYGNLLTFCEDFVALSIAIAIPTALTVRVVSDSNRTDVFQSKFGIAFSAAPR